MKLQTMYDDFTVKGVWWIPGSEDLKVAGHLVVKAGIDMDLELIGALKVKGETQIETGQRQFSLGSRLPVIWGKAIEYGPVTLFDAIHVGSHTGSAGGPITDFKPGICAIGLWFEDSESDLKFETLAALHAR